LFWSGHIFQKFSRTCKRAAYHCISGRKRSHTQIQTHSHPPPPLPCFLKLPHLNLRVHRPSGLKKLKALSSKQGQTLSSCQTPPMGIIPSYTKGCVIVRYNPIEDTLIQVISFSSCLGGVCVWVCGSMYDSFFSFY